MRKTFAPVALLTTVLLVTLACSNPQKAALQHVERGDQYLKDGKEADALLQYRNAVEKDPMLGDARKKLGLAYGRAGNFKAALGQLIRAADLLPDDADAQLTAGVMLLQTGQFQDAGARAARVLARDPKNSWAHVLQGNASAGLKDLDGAVTQLEEAISLDPKRTENYANLGAIEAARGRQEEAEAAYLKAIEVAPEAVEPRLAIANYYWQTRRHKDVEENLAAALRIDPKNVPANRAMAMLKVLTGNPAAAELHLKAVVDNTTEPGARIALADFLIAQNRPDEVVPLLTEVAKDPKAFAAATSRLAGVAYLKGERTKAYEMLDAVLAKEPSNTQVLFAKGSWQLAEARVDEAEKTAQSALKADPNSIQAHQLAGNVFSAQNKVDQAITEFQEVLKLNPKAVAAQLRLAALHEAKGGKESTAVARQHAQDAVKLAPQSVPARYALVRTLIAAGDATAAARELEPLASSHLDSYEVQLSLGRIALLKRDDAAARTALDRAVTLQPTGLEALAALSSLEARNQRLPRVQELVRTALKAKPTDPGLLVLSARLDLVGGQLQAAEQTLRRVVDASPDYLPAYDLLGQLLVRQKNLDGARVEYERLAARAPNAVGPQTMVAMIHQVQGRESDAAAAYKKILEIDSRAVVANNNLAYIYAEKETDLDMALQMAQAAKAASPDDPDVNDTLGWVYYKKGLHGQAIAPLLQSIQIQPSNPIYHYHLGLVYQKTGQREKARTALSRALELGNFPESGSARKALEELR